MTPDVHSGHATDVLRAGGPGRILLVEDAVIDRMIARDVLERAGFAVDVAEDGLEAVRAVERSADFDLILMDIDMPVMDGYEAAAHIRARPPAEGGATPILALSALAFDPGADVSVSIDGRMTKPYEPSQLIDRVRALLRPRPAAEPAVDAPPIWNLRTYEDVVSRHGAGRMVGHLARVRGNFESVIGVVERNSGDARILAREAHGLVSAAGMLGFEELTDVCIRAQTATAGEGCRALADELVASLARALTALSGAPATCERLGSGSV